ncbi:MAG TPA: hypothetical protein VND15_00275 [Candidatus Acidoferrales bacterium]|nr:hypothetical protein [Candidatus Acidoferrales bacterium]
MIKPTCAMCGKELTKFGAILLGPPGKTEMVKKTHLCVDCYSGIMKKMGKESK